MNKQEFIDLRVSLSGKMSRCAYWMQLLMLAGLTLLVLFGWALLSIDKLMDIVFTSGVDLDYISPRDIFDGWQTCLLGVYGVWLLVITFCMLVRRLHDVGKSALLPVLWWVFNVGGIFTGVTASEDESIRGAIAGLMIVIAAIIGIILLVNTLRGSKVVEGEETTPVMHAGACLLALVPWVLVVLLYNTCASSWVEFTKGCIAIDHQDEVVAKEHFIRAAERGNEVAKLILLEEAVRRNDPAALPTVCQLAESGNAFAQFILSGMYVNGYLGLEPNRDEALKWLKKAADQGCRPAMEKLQESFLPESAPTPEPSAPAAEPIVPESAPAPEPPAPAAEPIVSESAPASESPAPAAEPIVPESAPAPEPSAPAVEPIVPESAPTPEPPAPAVEAPVPAGTPAICTVCGGKGVNAAGYTCPVCGGTGVAK